MSRSIIPASTLPINPSTGSFADQNTRDSSGKNTLPRLRFTNQPGNSCKGSRLPSIKLLKAEKEQLLQKKKEEQKNYHYYRDYQRELNTVCSNVDKILGQARTRQPEKQKGADIS